MPVRDATGAQLSGDAKFALLADFSALAGKLFRITRIINHSLTLQAVKHRLDYGFVVAASFNDFFISWTEWARRINARTAVSYNSGSESNLRGARNITGA